MLNDPTIAEVAYAAGLFDGEGCISISYQKAKCRKYYYYRHQLSICISQKREPVIRWLEKKFGGSVRYQTGKRSYDRGRYTRWDWRLGAASAAAFLREIRPFLIVKAAEADVAIEFAATMDRRRRAVPPEVLARRSEAIKILSELKHAI